MTATVSTPSTPPAPSTPTHAFDAPPTAKRRDPWQVVRYLAIGAALIFALFPIWFIVAAAVNPICARSSMSACALSTLRAHPSILCSRTNVSSSTPAALYGHAAAVLAFVLGDCCDVGRGI